MKTNLLIAGLVSLWMTGCSESHIQDDSGADSGGPVVMDDLPPMMDEHAHPEHGPHGGELVELGKEAFHIETMHGTGAVALYVLDGAAVEPVAIDAAMLTVSLKHDGGVKSFELPADPQTNDTEGMSSRFTSTDPVMDQWMEAGAEGVIIVNIKGKSFTGKISHEHDHAGHDHDGHDHGDDGHDHDDHDDDHDGHDHGKDGHDHKGHDH